MSATVFRNAQAERAGGIYALLVLLLIVAAACWARPLMLPDEGRYVGVAWEMLRSGDWLTPTLDGLPFFHKPPLFYWITAASLWAFGLNELAARVAPLCGLLAATAALFVFSRRWCSEREAALAIVALLAQPLFLCAGQFANLDMLVAGLITTTILLAAHVVLSAEVQEDSRKTLYAAYATAALGVLAKGLIGVVIPLLVIGAWLLMSGRWRRTLSLLSWAGVAIFLAIALPWFIAMQLRFDGFFNYFIVVQHFNRFAAGGFNNAQPFWFYFLLLLALSTPWLPWLYRQLKLVSTRSPNAPIRGLMLLWLAVVLVFFSLPQSKLVGYVLPAVPPLAWLVADGYAGSGVATRRLRFMWWMAALLGLGVTAVIAVALTVSPQRSSRELADELRARRAPNEPVVMLARFDFDVPFYARLREPITIVDDWSNQKLHQQDNWRLELVDAARFDPRTASRVLVQSRDLVRVLCRAPVVWVIGDRAEGTRVAALARAQIDFTSGGTTLWRVERAAVGSDADMRCKDRSRAESPDL